MRFKATMCAVLMGIVMIFCGTAYAEEQAVQQDDQQNKVYQTEDGVLSIQAPNSQWSVMTDPNYWFVLSDGGNTITIDHLANGEALPAAAVAGGETAAVCQTFVSTKNEVFIIKGSAVKQENLVDIMKAISTIKVLKYDTKTAIRKDETAADKSFSVKPINETYYSLSDHLNVRLGCSTNDTSIGHLTYGEAIKVIGAVFVDGEDIGWDQVNYKGTDAYVSAQYLSKKKPENSGDKPDADGAASDEYFLVYGTDGISVAIHSTGGGQYADDYGHTYSYNGGGMYYCNETGLAYSTDRDTWDYDDNVNTEGDPYGDYDDDDDIDYDNVNIEGDPYGDLVTGGDGYDYYDDDDDIDYDNVNIEGDPYGELVTGGDGYDDYYYEDDDIDYDNVNIEGDDYDSWN